MRTNKKLVLIRSIFLITAFACAGILSILFCSSFITSNINKGDLNPVKRTIVWDAGENDVDGYRIPGIVVTKSGSVLVFAEERPQYGDADPKSIVLKRSEDSGLTWSENIYIEKSDGKYWSKHRDKIAPNDVTNKKEVWTNPAPLVDMMTGRIFVFYSLSEGMVAGQNLQRYTKVYYKYSDDDGLNWSDRIEVTDVINSNKDGLPNKDEKGNWITDVNGFPCDYLGRAFHMPGPGHGIQLVDGRLLLQVWNRTALGKIAEGYIPSNKRRYGICTIYSDDHGKSWNYGSAFGHEIYMTESRMVELENGDIYINARITDGQRNNHRATAISHDNGINWGNFKIDNNFPLSNACDAGLINTRLRDNSVILYSKNESYGETNIEGRKNLVVRLSYDDGKSWPLRKLIDEGAAWYSDMAVLPDKTILLVYETGKERPVYLVRFSLDWLINPVD